MRPRPATAALAFTLFGLLTTVMLHWSAVQAFDTGVSGLAERFGRANPAWIDLLQVVTFGGTGIMLTFLTVLASAWLLAVRRYADLALVLLGVAATSLLIPATQYSIERQRPVDGFVSVPAPSFPSGHTVHAATVSVLLILLLWRRCPARARGWLVAGAVAWTLLIGVSRVLLRAHWPTDVLGSCLLVTGVLMALAEALTWGHPRGRRSVGSAAAGTPAVGAPDADPGAGLDQAASVCRDATRST